MPPRRPTEVAADQTLVTSVPMRGEDTAYTAIGDFFAYVATLVMLAMIGWCVVAALALRRRSGQTQRAGLPADGSVSHKASKEEVAAWLSS